MACESPYDEMMSLKLDGLLDIEGECSLQAHIEDCTECALLWAAMEQADSLLWATVSAPIPVPASFQASVLLKIAHMPVYRPQFDTGGAIPAYVSVLPLAPAHQAEHPFPLGSVETLQEWQRRLSHYLRGIAAAGLAVAGTASLMIALMLSGVIKLDGPFAGAVAMLRTFFGALNTWIGSIFVGVGTGTVAAGGLVMGLLALVAWQMVSAYHRNVAIEYGNSGLAEALG